MDMGGFYASRCLRSISRLKKGLDKRTAQELGRMEGASGSYVDCLGRAFREGMTDDRLLGPLVAAGSRF